MTSTPDHAALSDPVEGFLAEATRDDPVGIVRRLAATSGHRSVHTRSGEKALAQESYSRDPISRSSSIH